MKLDAFERYPLTFGPSPVHRVERLTAERMITDPVYEGESTAGLIDLVAGGQVERGSTVLYAHLGGQPALSASAAVLR